MKELLKAFLESKKAAATLCAMLVIVFGKIGWNLDAAALLTWVSPLLVFIAGQAVADHGKEAAKVQAAAEAKRKPGAQ